MATESNYSLALRLIREAKEKEKNLNFPNFEEVHAILLRAVKIAQSIPYPKEASLVFYKVAKLWEKTGEDGSRFFEEAKRLKRLNG